MSNLCPQLALSRRCDTGNIDYLRNKQPSLIKWGNGSELNKLGILGRQNTGPGRDTNPGSPGTEGDRSHGSRTLQNSESECRGLGNRRGWKELCVLPRVLTPHRCPSSSETGAEPGLGSLRGSLVGQLVGLTSCCSPLWEAPGRVMHLIWHQKEGEEWTGPSSSSMLSVHVPWGRTSGLCSGRDPGYTWGSHSMSSDPLSYLQASWHPLGASEPSLKTRWLPNMSLHVQLECLKAHKVMQKGCGSSPGPHQIPQAPSQGSCITTHPPYLILKTAWFMASHCKCWWRRGSP